MSEKEMNKKKSEIVHLIKNKETLLYFVLSIAVLTFIGWISGSILLTSFSHEYKPVSPIIALTFIALGTLLLISIKHDKSRSVERTVTISVIIILLFYCLIYIGYIGGFSVNIEKFLVKNFNIFGTTQSGLMSPMASILILFISLSMLAVRNNSGKRFKYIGGSLSLSAFFFSFILLIGYLYNAPLLFGGKIIPVALPASLCFFLFSFTLLRLYDLRYWTFNLIKDNKVTRILLKSFLPTVIIIVLVQGYADTIISLSNFNPALSGAIILLMVTGITSVILFRVSAVIGNDLVNAEKSLKESEQRFSRAINSAPFPIMIHAENGSVLSISQGWNDISGYTLADIPTIEAWTERAFGERSTMVKEYIDTLYELTGSKNEGEYTILCKDGTERIWDFSSAFLGNFDNYGRVVISMAKDVTDRKLEEEALKKSEYNLQERIKELNGIYTLGILTERKEILEEIFDEFVKSIVPASMQFPEKVFVSLEIEGVNYCNSENLNHLKDTKYLSAPIVVFGKKKGELIVSYTEDLPFIELFELRLINNYAGRISNIIERIETKRALEISEKNLRQLNLDKDRFISILGHDLKGPLNNILGLSEVLTEEMETLRINEIGDIANNIYKSAKTTNHLLEDILMWARTHQGKIPFNPRHLRLSAIFKSAIEILNPGAFAKNITIYSSDADHLEVFADIDMLKTIMLNLISNAIKFTNNGGEINIEATKNSENIIISVSDNGVGIPKDTLSKLFDISEVITTSGTAKETGTGLGLLLCKDFIEIHAGKIWVESEVGKGSYFKFTLPGQK
jgi:PAS domain S-box-containing protein